MKPDLTRRQFIATATAAAATAAISRQALCDDQPATAPANNRIDVGPASKYADDATYDQFRSQGVFLISKDHKITAISSVCTHKGCKVNAKKDQSFICKCHNSQFDRDGKVTHGPATKDLPHLAVTLDDRQHVMVDVDRKLPPS